MPIVTTVLEVLGVLLIVAFCLVLWWPSALLVGGVALLIVSWSLTPRSPKPPSREMT